MEQQKAYIVLATLFLTTSTQAVNIQAEFDVGGGNSEFLQMIVRQIEMLGGRGDADLHPNSLTQGHTELASALLQVAPVVTIKGQIKDPSRRLTVSFEVHASQDRDPSSDEVEDDVPAVDVRRSRGSGGLLQPLVLTMEPYVVGLAELVFNGILSSVISNVLEGVTLGGDIRLI